jgi:IPT/TIG domain
VLLASYFAPSRVSFSGVLTSVCTYVGAPTVTGVSPTFGPLAGGTTVTITGCGFTGATAVHFGATAATGVVVNSDTSVTAVSPAHAIGTVHVTVTTPGGTSATSVNDQFTFTAPCTSVTETAAPPTTSPSGTTVTFTAVASGCALPLYQFWILAPGSTTWTILQAYSSTSTATWNTLGLLAGIYHYTVWARDTSSAGTQSNNLGSFDAAFQVAAYTLTATPCTAVAESVSPSSPQASGVTITFSAVAATCPHPLYQFWLLAPGSTTWTIVQAYSASASFVWDTTGSIAGVYHYTVWVRDSGSAGMSCNNLGCFDAFSPSTAYTLTTVPCTSVTESVSPSSPRPVGTVVTFTAVASTCPHPLYQFWILAPGSTTWTIGQAYSTTATFNWNTTGLVAGTYTYTVWARDSGSAGTNSNNLGTFDAAFPIANYTLTITPCTSVSETAAPPTTAVHGTTVTFTAVASGCPNPLYQFWILAPGSTTWMIGQAYSPTATFSWNTTGLAPGVYRYTVWVRDASSSGTGSNNLGSFDAFFPATNYTLT